MGERKVVVRGPVWDWWGGWVVMDGSDGWESVGVNGVWMEVMDGG